MLAITAYGMWGLLPVYWKLLQTVSPLVILAHRIVWGFAFSLLMLAFFKRLPEIRKVLSNKKSIFMLVLSSLLISINWMVYIWAVNDGQVVETALGYFINPLVIVFLGMIFLGERLNIAQVVALVLAASGVTIEIVSYAQVPWIALTLAFSFGLYGLCKKIIAAESLVSLSLETLFAIPLAAAMFIVSYLQPDFLPGSEHTTLGISLPDWLVTLVLFCAGPMTALPLWSFGAAARLIPLSSMGFFQYLAPSITLILGVTLFKEPFGLVEGLCFACIWAGLVVYSANQFLLWRRSRASA